MVVCGMLPVLPHPPRQGRINMKLIAATAPKCMITNPTRGSHIRGRKKYSVLSSTKRLA